MKISFCKKYIFINISYKNKVILQFWLNRIFPFIHYAKYKKPSKLGIKIYNIETRLKNLEDKYL